MPVSVKTKELIDRFITNISAFPNCDQKQLGEDIYSIVDYSLKNHLVGPMAQYKEDIRQDCAIACWRKIAEGKIKFLDRRILGFFRLVTLNTMRNEVKRITNSANMLKCNQVHPNTISVPFDFSILLESDQNLLKQ